MTRSVLIADDVAEIRRLLRLIVTRYSDLEVVGEAEDGLEVLRLAEELTPDIVLLDLNMPVRSGLEVLPEIRALLPDAAIVVFSGFESGDMAERTSRLGADAYIEKGTAAPEIVERILAAIEERPLD